MWVFGPFLLPFMDCESCLALSHGCEQAGFSVALILTPGTTLEPWQEYLHDSVGDLKRCALASLQTAHFQDYYTHKSVESASVYALSIELISDCLAIDPHCLVIEQCALSISQQKKRYQYSMPVWEEILHRILPGNQEICDAVEV